MGPSPCVKSQRPLTHEGCSRLLVDVAYMTLMYIFICTQTLARDVSTLEMSSVMFMLFVTMLELFVAVLELLVVILKLLIHSHTYVSPPHTHDQDSRTHTQDTRTLDISRTFASTVALSRAFMLCRECEHVQTRMICYYRRSSKLGLAGAVCEHTTLSDTCSKRHDVLIFTTKTLEER